MRFVAGGIASGEGAKEIDAWKNPARRVAFYGRRRKFERSSETRKRNEKTRGAKPDITQIRASVIAEREGSSSRFARLS